MTPFTYYRWRREFGGLKSDEKVKRLKDLEKENDMDHIIIQFDVSERLACRVLGRHRSNTKRKAPRGAHR